MDAYQHHNWRQNEVFGPLTTDSCLTVRGDTPLVVQKGGTSKAGSCLNPWGVQSKHIMSADGTSEALCSGEKRWAGLPPNVLYKAVYDARGNGEGGVSPALTRDHQNRITDYTAICVEEEHE